MSAEQAVFAIAGAVCILGAVMAVTHREPRVAGAGLLLALLSLTVLYASLAAPALAAIVFLIYLFATLPLAIHLTVPAPRAAEEDGGPRVEGAALLLGLALIALLDLAVWFGEVPLNVSVRSTDGYDLPGLGALLTGRALVPPAASALLLVAALVGVRAARRSAP